MYRPYLYLLLFLLVDKLLLVPAIRERFTLSSGMIFDVHQIADEQEFGREDRFQVWAFGTSRSLSFARLTDGASVDGRPVAVHTLAYAGAVPSVYLHQYLYLRDRGYRPDAVWIEVSAFAVNRNYALRGPFLYESAPDRFILYHLMSYPPSFLAAWARGRLFYGSVYPPGFYGDRERGLVQILNPLKWEDRVDAPTFTSEQLAEKHDNDAYRLFFREVYIEGHLDDFELDPVAIDSLKYLIDHLRRDGVPYVAWQPPVHETLSRLYAEAGVHPSFDSLLQRPQVHYDPAIGVGCDRFRDESHLAIECYPLMARQLLNSTR